MSPAPALRGARLAIALLFFLNGALFACWVSRIPQVQHACSLDHGELGLALLAAALGALLAMPLAGACIHRFGSRGVSRWTAVGYVLVMPLLGLAHNGLELAGALLALGATYGALDVSMNAQAVAVERLFARPIMSSFHAVFSFGGLFGAAFGALVASAGIAPLAHFTAAALLLGGGAVAVAWPLLISVGDAVRSEPRAEGAPPRGWQWPPSTLLALGAIAFCIMMGEGAIADWSAVFMRDVIGASAGVSALGFASFSVAMAAGRLFGDHLALRFGPVALVRGGTALAAAGMAVPLLFPNPGAALLGFAAVGAGFAPLVPQVFSAAGRTPGISAGPAIAITTTLGYLGFLVGPPLIGGAAEFVGLRAALSLVVAITCIACALARVVSPKRRVIAVSGVPSEEL